MKHWFLDRVAGRGEAPAFVFEGERVSYAAVAARADAWGEELDRAGVAEGVVVVHGDHSPVSFALLLALAARRAIIVPLTTLPQEVLEARCKAAGAGWLIDCLAPGGVRFKRRAPGVVPGLIGTLRARGHAGLILFSSGSSGEPKACLLDLDRLLERVRGERRGYVTLAFLLFDHIGGINTMINVLGHGGTAVVIADRSVEAVARAIEAHRVELLPTSPTFLKMLLISDAARRHDLSSIELITYGTEAMPQATLAELHRTFSAVRFKQTYGLSEIGIVPTRSRAPASLWMQIGSDVEHKVVDGTLWLRAPTAMLGYLNAPSPFDADGWLNTGDRVEIDGDFLKIVGRDSELINVGGEKVHPAEVENVLMGAENVLDVTVSGRPNPVTGAVVVATVALIRDEDHAALSTRLDRFCRAWLEPHKVPMAYQIDDGPLHSPRFKKIRARPA